MKETTMQKNKFEKIIDIGSIFVKIETEPERIVVDMKDALRSYARKNFESLYHRPLSSVTEFGEKDRKKIAIDTVGKWLFGAPHHPGHIFITIKKVRKNTYKVKLGLDTDKYPAAAFIMLHWLLAKNKDYKLVGDKSNRDLLPIDPFSPEAMSR